MVYKLPLTITNSKGPRMAFSQGQSPLTEHVLIYSIQVSTNMGSRLITCDMVLLSLSYLDGFISTAAAGGAAAGGGWRRQ